MLKKIFILIIMMIVIALDTSCSLQKNKEFNRQDFLMGTIVSQRIFDKNAQSVSDKVVQRLNQIEDKMTINKEDSEVIRINTESGIKEVKVSDDTFFVIKSSLDYSKLSEAAFDVTIGPLVKDWGIFTDNPKIPSKDEINNLLKLVNYKDVKIDELNKTVKLERKGQIIDLGGIAKGYAGDEAVSIMKNNGVKSGYVNLGGNVVTLGTKPDGSLWKIGVQNPRADNGKYIGILKISDKAVVTSGDYERFFEKDGVRYHHILDPKTGYPSQSDLLSATIVCESSILADGLSTSTFVLGLDKAYKLIESLDNVGAVFITKDKNVYVTDKLKSSFSFEDESKEYKYVQKR